MAKQHILQAARGEAHSFVLGLTWRKIVMAAGSAEAEARSHAAGDGGTHAVFDVGGVGGDIRAVGYGRIPAKVKGPLALGLGLALSFSRTAPHVCAMEISDELAWLLFIRGGMVEIDQVLSRHEVLDQLEELKEAHGQSLTIRGDLDPDGESFDWRTAKSHASNVAAKVTLKPLKSGAAIRRRLPYIAGGAVLLIGAKLAIQQLDAARAKEALDKQPVPATVEESPEEVWRRAVADWSQRKLISDGEDLRSVFSEVGKVPQTVANWGLSTVDCNRGIEARSWVCTATYERKTDLRASSEYFLKTANPDWAVSWIGLDKATAVFEVVSKADALKVDALPRMAGVELSVRSDLQRVSKAFDGLALASFSDVAIDIPKKPDGTANVVDPATRRPVVVTAEVSATSGPMRSAYTLMGMPINFTSFKLELKDGEAATLTKSMLTIKDLKGSIYAVK